MPTVFVFNNSDGQKIKPDKKILQSKRFLSEEEKPTKMQTGWLTANPLRKSSCFDDGAGDGNRTHL